MDALTSRTRFWLTTALLTGSIVSPSAAYAQQQRISGEDFVEFGKDTTGLTHYTKSGTMCVVHRPDCGIVGHNGNDHFFPANMQLPKGVVLNGVQFKVFWPTGLTHTDRGGLGSKGSYGASADKQFQSKPPLYSVHWENACEASTSNDWSTLPITYQVSFTVTVPAGVTLKNSVNVEPDSGDICNASDLPVPKPTQGGSPSGWAGQVLFCNGSNVAVTEYLHIRAKLVTAYPGAQGSGGMTEDNLPLQFPPGGSTGSDAGFKTAQKYEQGTWSITDVYLTTAPASPPTATVRNAVHLPVTFPVSAVLPGNPSSPVFDFRGGACPAL
jgi:hypothetical protein